jgi:uncharacterized coiled-coil DUF342 family protein
MPKETNAKKEAEQIKNAEKKFQSYIERRNELNELAKLVRDERDMFNTAHKEQRATMKSIRSQRDELVTQMRHHKELRNKFQEQAKALIEARRKKRGEVFKNLPLRVEELKADVQMLEYRQETIPMKPAEENELIDKIREKRVEFENAKKRMEKQKELEIDISDKDSAISDFFKKADEEHLLVQKYYEESQKKHEEYMKLVHELSVSIAEANKKHQQYVEIREEAQKNHEKAMEMRSKIISTRDEKRRQRDDARRAIQEINKQARDAVLDKTKLEEIADKSVNALKKGEKISL